MTVHEVRLHFSGSQSHILIGNREKHHKPLRGDFRILKQRHPTMKPEIIMRFVIKGPNDTMGTDGSVPSLLVFWDIVHVFMAIKNAATQKKRINALLSARDEFANICAEQQVNKIIRGDLPPAAIHKHKSGNIIYAHIERRTQLISELRVVDVHGKNILINDGSSMFKINITQVFPQPTGENVDHDVMKLIISLKQFNTGGVPGVCITTLLAPNDPRRCLHKFDAAKETEIRGASR